MTNHVRSSLRKAIVSLAMLCGIVSALAPVRGLHAQQRIMAASGTRPTQQDPDAPHLDAGTMLVYTLTFSLSKCPAAGCKLKLACAPAVTTPATPPLTFVTKNGSVVVKTGTCNAAANGSVDAGTLPGSGGNGTDYAALTIEFSYPVSWTGTLPGTYRTSGITLGFQ